MSANDSINLPPSSIQGFNPAILKPIPTKYSGYRFRSRSEARWAVFFDSIRLPFDYEPEGFLFADSSCYLPDFYLPSVRMWAEVKGAYFGLDEERRCEQVCRGTRRNFLYLDGSPNFRAYYGATVDAGDVTVVPYSLDIHWFDKAYREKRLFAQPEYDGADPAQFSKQYQIAIYESRRDRFGEKNA